MHREHQRSKEGAQAELHFIAFPGVKGRPQKAKEDEIEYEGAQDV
jgi:hypothetical protein